MPMISSSSGFQINGGNFYEIAGDMNLHGTQPTVGPNSNPLTALIGVTEGPSRRLLGVERNGRHGGAARAPPYGMLLAWLSN
jgi:hypothetical protein